MLDADGKSGDDSIKFDLTLGGNQITLANHLTIADDATIMGLGSKSLTISG